MGMPRLLLDGQSLPSFDLNHQQGLNALNRDFFGLPYSRVIRIIREAKRKT
jgi:hypothetical protein